MIVKRALALILMMWTWPALAAAEGSIEVWKSATCECCGAWVKHLEDNGFAVKVSNATPPMLERIKGRRGLARTLPPVTPARSDPMSSRAMCRQMTSSD
jgi:hypothetical protein